MLDILREHMSIVYSASENKDHLPCVKGPGLAFGYVCDTPQQAEELKNLMNVAFEKGRKVKN